MELDQEAIRIHQHASFAEMDTLLRAFPRVTVLGSAPERCGAASFLLDGAHPSDVGAFLDQAGVAVRTGHHCCQPLMARYAVNGTVRASLALASQSDDVESLIMALRQVAKFF